MKKTIKTISIIVLVIVVLISNTMLAQQSVPQKYTRSVTNVAEFKMNMRKLWQDHVVWTRNVILCIVDDLPGRESAEKRLLQNQDDLGNALIPYYGEKAGKRFTALLYPHITIAAEVVKALKTGNIPVRDEAGKRWFANADEISQFLNNANSQWALEDMKKMMNYHLRLTTDEAVQRIRKKYDADVITFDTIHNEIIKMADMFADGIVQQFPEKFKKVNSKLTSQ